MDRLEIERLDIDPHTEEKLWAAHDGLTVREIEQALMDEDAVVEDTPRGTHEVYGRTFGGLHVLVVLVPKGEGLFTIVTAFPMGPRRVQWFENRRRRG